MLSFQMHLARHSSPYHSDMRLESEVMFILEKGGRGRC